MMDLTRILTVSLLLTQATRAQEPEQPPPPMSVAVLTFQESDAKVQGLGEQSATLLGAFLSTNENLAMVERAELDKILSEHELTLSGTVNNATAAKIGQLTGAKVLITGRVFPVGKQTYVIAKIIGVETSRVYGETAKLGNADELDAAITTLSEKIGATITERRETLLAQVETEQQRLERLRKVLGQRANLPKVYVSIPEQHISRAIPDPAAQTEIQRTLQQLGFGLTEAMDEAGARVIGEGFSELAGRRGQLISCRARVEIKVQDGKGKLIAVDRQTEAAVDLAENVASKSALQKAGQVLAERIVAELAKLP